MKRLGSDDSLGALISICPTTGEHSPGSTHVYNREFQSMLDGLDEEGCIEESVHISEKKRRLSVDQVKALEKNFEIENKLEPERKVKLAQELGLQPRQVAVWFQNRRARWKTKQLERDYGLLKASYDTLKLSYESLQHENDSLLKEVRDLKSKLDEESGEGQILVKEEEMIVSESENNTIIETEEEAKLNYEGFNNALAAEVSLAADLKDGSSDSDSSAILQEERSPVAESSSFQNHHHHHHHHQQMAPAPSCFAVGPSSHQKAYQPQFVKMEEHNFFGAEEPCNFFSDDPAPTLQWYCSDQWI